MEHLRIPGLTQFQGLTNNVKIILQTESDVFLLTGAGTRGW
jgi:hypothetical protein